MSEMDNALLCAAYASVKACAVIRRGGIGLPSRPMRQCDPLDLQLGITDVRFDARH